MAARHLLLLALVCLHAPHQASAQQPEEATVIVKGSAKIAQTDVNYICATIDWWPPEKCNYNQCPWGQSSILNLDLDHPFLAQVIQEFHNLRIRLGGSLQDRVVYGVGTNSPCSPFTNVSNGLFGFSAGCLSMDRWDKLNDLFQKTGAVITFGLNALHGRYNVQRSFWAGKWNSTNTYDFVKYTISKGYPIDSWEFGNELSGHGTGARVDAKLYGKDVTELKSILRQLYRTPLSQPLLLAPGGFFDQQWYTQLLQTSGHGVVNALTHHIYNLGGGDDVHLMRKIVDPKYLDRAEDTYRDMQLTLQRHGTWASSWVSESGGVFNNGRQLVSNTFMNSIWYLDQLGMASKYNTKVFCRQTLIGGNYGLLDKQTFLPNPDYYSALLWHRLMGNGVLSVDINAPRKLRAYAHCSKRHERNHYPPDQPKQQHRVQRDSPERPQRERREKKRRPPEARRRAQESGLVAGKQAVEREHEEGRVPSDRQGRRPPEQDDAAQWRPAGAGRRRHQRPGHEPGARRRGFAGAPGPDVDCLRGPAKV
ncbi:unnamed protein product [Triticum turgidum subsp. durum]|uniref:Heparanase-like protein 1 n=1 Tax=Triticum turgidum subsp. durum TaxID=4567 RepID=A0A9R0S7S8_TRITD|nr:unnamed protein product [Triticum turgidum subsp. durum]